MCKIAEVVKFHRSGIDIYSLKTLSQNLSWHTPNDWEFLGWSGEEPPQISRYPETINIDWIALVHCYLSTLYLSEIGWPSMGTPDGCHYIGFSAVIYNYLELQAELKTLSYKFHAHSNTEVLPIAFSHWGKSSFTEISRDVCLCYFRYPNAPSILCV